MQVVGVLIDQLLPDVTGPLVAAQRLVVATQVCVGGSKKVQKVAHLILMAEVVRKSIDVFLPGSVPLLKNWERLSVVIQLPQASSKIATCVGQAELLIQVVGIMIDELLFEDAGLRVD